MSPIQDGGHRPGRTATTTKDAEDRSRGDTTEQVERRGDDLRIDRIELITAGPDAAKDGLLGWIRCRLNRRLLLDGIALRRTLDGRSTLSFPARTDASGTQHFFLRPLDDRTRIAIEQQVFAALRLDGYRDQARPCH